MRGGGRRRRAGRPRAELPRTPDGLRALPGIGPYTARAVLIFAHNDDLAAVDANVRRVLTHELDLPEDLGDTELQAVADAVLPRGRSRDWHNALMDYGSLVLTARSTGIASRSRQGDLRGLAAAEARAPAAPAARTKGPQPLEDLAGARPAADEAADLVALLRRDGLVTESGGIVERRVSARRQAGACATSTSSSVPARPILLLRRGPLAEIGAAMRRLRELAAEAGARLRCGTS